MFNQLQPQQPQHQQQLLNGNVAIAYHFNTNANRNVYDWYQTNTHVIINIMIKNLKEADVKVKLIDETLDVTCDLADGSIFKLHFNLFKPIYVQDSNWSVTPSKLEIQLKKTDRKRWQSLELIPEKSKQRSSHSNSLHHNHNHSPQTQPQPSTQQQQQQQQLLLQTQIEAVPEPELQQSSEQAQQLQQSEPEIESKVKIETEEPEVQCHMELQHPSELQPERKVEPSSDQTQPQSQVTSHEPQQPTQVQSQQAQQYAFTTSKSNPEELEFLTNSVELSSSLIELDFVLSV